MGDPNKSEKPIIPELVPVTIRWVDADRAYRTSLGMTVGILCTGGLLTVFQFPSSFTLAVILTGSVMQTFLRAIDRYRAEKALSAMKRRMGLD